jgi:monosaccharide-transporting ATPase
MKDATDAGLAFVHQELASSPNLSVAENVFLGLGFPHRGPFVAWGELRRRAQDVLDSIGAGISASAPSSALTAVQQRLVMIARALAQQSRVLILDEPSAALSPAEVQHLHEVVGRLADRGVAVMYVSHRLEEIMAITSRVLVMRDGHIVAERRTGETGLPELVQLITGHDSVNTALERVSRRRASAGQALIEVTDLVAEPPVAGVSFSLFAGEVLGLAGLLGSGRTETARALCGAVPAVAGTIRVRGEVTRLRTPVDAIARGIVLLPEDRRAEGNVLDFTVRENMTLASLPNHRRWSRVPIPSRDSERRAARSAIDRLKLRTAGTEGTVRTLSGGNQQKVLFAKWLQRDADVFVLDEPTQGIDVDAKEEVFNLVAELSEEGKGVIFISSDFSELVRTCDRVVTIRDGRSVGEFTGDQIAEGALLRACFGVAAAPGSRGPEHDRAGAAVQQEEEI